MHHLTLVQEFHRAFEIARVEGATLNALSTSVLRGRLISEEGLHELARAFGARDVVGVLDALIDLEYVVLGTYDVHGLEPRRDAETELEPSDSTPHVMDRGLQLNALAQVAFHLGDYLSAASAYDRDGIQSALNGMLRVVFAALNAGGMWKVRAAAFAEVHRSNMSKLGLDGRPMRDETGKVVKGPSYTPPNLISIVALYTPPPVQTPYWPHPLDGY